MAKTKVPENVKKQVRDLSYAGMKPKEIMRQVEEKFGVDVPYSTVYAIIHTRAKGKVKTEKKGKVALRKGSKVSVGDAPEDAGKIAAEIKSLIDEMQSLYINSLKAVRSELIAAVQKLRTVTEEQA